MKIDFITGLDEPESQSPHRNRHLVLTFVSGTILTAFTN